MDSLPRRITGSIIGSNSESNNGGLAQLARASRSNAGGSSVRILEVNGGLAQLDSLPRRITGSTIGSNSESNNGGLAQLAYASRSNAGGPSVRTLNVIMGD